jgi:predicted phage gp36 major capsid-like protein
VVQPTPQFTPQFTPQPTQQPASPSTAQPASIGDLLMGLRTMVRAQAEAINTDDFVEFERLTAEVTPLIASMSQFATADLSAADRVLIEQVSALDQQLLELARESLSRTGQEMRDIDRGRAALHQYGQRGQTLIRNLAALNQQP